jgi:hypothetical protein
LRISDIHINEPTVSLQVQTVSGKQYQIESSSALYSWQPIGDSFDGTGGLVDLMFNLPPPSGSRFFRVRLLQ